jgi:hypothetical protein
MKCKGLGIPLLFGVFALVCGPIKATTLYEAGFEQPTFATGPVAGQDGWSFFASGGSSTANVENVFAATGSQALEVDPAGGQAQAGPYKQVTTSASSVIQSASIYIGSSTTQSEWQFAALDSSFQFAGGIRINPNGSIDEISAGFNSIGSFALNSWNTVSLLLDYATQTYSIDLNGTSLATNIAMCGDNSTCTSGNTLSGYSYGFFLFCDEATICSNGAINANDIAYLDDYSVSSTPLPAALPLFGTSLGALALFASSRKRKKSIAVV